VATPGDRLMRNPTHGIHLCAVGAVLALFLPFTYAQGKPAADPDAECLACHSQSDLKTEKGQSVFVDPAKHKASVHADLSCTTCHTDIKEFPHSAKVAKVNCASCHEEPAADVPKSIHAVLGDDACQGCHGPAHYTQPAAKIIPERCRECHAEEVKGFLSSVHGQAAKNGDSANPGCKSCHGPIHKIVSSADPTSPVAKKNLPDTCGSCHSSPEFLARHHIPFAHPVESYKLSIHGRALAAGNEKAASCSDCHGSHAIYRARNQRSPVNHWNVPKTCGRCHAEIKKTYDESVHGQAVARGATDAPVCTDCHGEHNILPPQDAGSLVNPSRVSLTTCGRCHGNQLLNVRYNLPADRVPTFADSYHGLESRAGGQTVANCASCHGVHNIFPSSDPRSTVNPANLAKTCGQCHPGAGKNFAIGPVHVSPESVSEHPVVKWIRRFYWVTIPFAIGFMFLHHFLDFLRKAIRGKHDGGNGGEVPRMNLNFRIAHWLTVLSFPVLVITGFALKFPDAWWARPLLIWESHFAFRGLVHRVAAVVLLSSLAYHVIHLVLVRRDRVLLRLVIPRPKDARDLLDMFLYNLGLSDHRPTFGPLSYVEKIEYLAFVWGTLVMAASGFILWFNNFALRHSPKWVTDAATVLHYYEAILATLAILIWHFYTVIFDPDVYPMDRAWLTGKASAEHMHETRPEYFAQLTKEEEKEEKEENETGEPREPPAKQEPPGKEDDSS